MGAHITSAPSSYLDVQGVPLHFYAVNQNTVWAVLYFYDGIPKIRLLSQSRSGTWNGPAERLIAAIQTDIFTGALRPGDRLDENALAQRFEVSRTPIREALRSLIDGGLLEALPRRGAYVRRLSASEVIEMFAVAAELEGMAGRLAANVATVEQAALIGRACRACREAADRADPVAYGDLNERFHEAIHAASGNSYLMQQLKIVEDRLQIYRRLPL